MSTEMNVRVFSLLIMARWPLIALAASAFMLSAAHVFETVWKLPPCALCLHQREAYWAAGSIALIAAIAERFRDDVLSQRAFALLLTCAFGAGAVIGGFHFGVEYKWWPGLAACAGGGNYDTSADLLGALSKSMDVPACDKVAWSLLGVSMAGWNTLISLGLMGVSFTRALTPSPVTD